ncbi:hypothetical protein [Marinicella meishanensis]|uniref:hypothetical protein n=1 Tax=Marinicella meishanensis TaxID=2873263 RepID=UPI001CBE273D|nr:hypothetical protein [Marinicella sp. NBU2979]
MFENLGVSSIIKVNTNGDISASLTALVLKRLSDAHFGLDAIEFMCYEFHRNPSSYSIAYNVEHEAWSMTDLPTFPLHINKVVIQSPGFWEFLGRLNPLEVIRQFLNDSHERKKDEEYRNQIEAEKMKIENSILRTELIKKSIEVLRETGMEEDLIRSVIRDNAIIPLLRLEALHDMNLISDVEVPSRKKEGVTEDA